MKRIHSYNVSIEWNGNKGKGTKSYTSYSRDYWVKIEGKPPIKGSSDPAFMGDKEAINPEELLVAAISACHMLWFLHLAAEADVVIIGYEDQAQGKMVEKADGSGHFEVVLLYPETKSINGDTQLVETIHRQAHEKCFIANSLNFPIEIHADNTIINQDL
jgi:organic hydroperoxide reductase OsmC/OhrA